LSSAVDSNTSLLVHFKYSPFDLFQEKFSREQDELKAKHQIELERAKQLEQELHKKVCIGIS
jgi:hypothetical protein